MHSEANNFFLTMIFGFFLLIAAAVYNASNDGTISSIIEDIRYAKQVEALYQLRADVADGRKNVIYHQNELVWLNEMVTADRYYVQDWMQEKDTAEFSRNNYANSVCKWNKWANKNCGFLVGDPVSQKIWIGSTEPKMQRADYDDAIKRMHERLAVFHDIKIHYEKKSAKDPVYGMIERDFYLKTCRSEKVTQEVLNKLFQNYNTTI